MNRSSTTKSGKVRNRFIKATARFVSRSKIEALVLILAVVVLTGMGSIVYRVVVGVSKTDDLPAHLVRLQVVEASGREMLLSEVVSGLSGYSSGDLEIQIVETEKFKVREVPKSFVISRQKDQRAAGLIARHLNLDVDEVVYRPLENNQKQVSVTLVLGTDFNLDEMPTPGK